MSMVAYARRVPAEQLTWLLVDVDRRFGEISGVDPDEDDVYEGFHSAPMAVDLYKSWDVADRLLSAAADLAPQLEACAGAVSGGHARGDDLGYGPLRTLDPPEVAAIARALAALEPEHLERARKTADLDGCYSFYPDQLDEATGVPTDIITAADVIDELRQLYADAERAGDGMLLWLT
jgi:hypothetical protein